MNRDSAAHVMATRSLGYARRMCAVTVAILAQACRQV